MPAGFEDRYHFLLCRPVDQWCDLEVWKLRTVCSLLQPMPQGQVELWSLYRQDLEERLD